MTSLINTDIDDQDAKAEAHYDYFKKLPAAQAAKEAKDYYINNMTAEEKRLYSVSDFDTINLSASDKYDRMRIFMYIAGLDNVMKHASPPPLSTIYTK